MDTIPGGIMFVDIILVVIIPVDVVCTCRYHTCRRVYPKAVYTTVLLLLLHHQDLVEAINQVRFERFDRVLHQVLTTCE